MKLNEEDQFCIFINLYVRTDIICKHAFFSKIRVWTISL